MNLPAKNIFVEDPKKGKGSPMKKGDFWNLVGRAGRLSKEFEGSVFCIFGKKWDQDVTYDKLVPIESAFEIAIEKRAQELAHAVKDPPESAEEKGQAWTEQVYARVYSDFVSSGKRLAPLANAKNAPELAEIDTYSERFERTLPDELYVDNFYLHPSRLEALATVFREATNVRTILPIKPEARSAYDNYMGAYEILQGIFIRSKFERFKYLAFLSIRWMRGDSLRDLIADAIDYRSVSGTEEINQLIHQIFEDIEKELRFTYVKYMRVYNDVLKAVLIRARV